MERGTAWLRVARDSFFTKHFGRYRETASLPTLGFGCCPPNKHQGSMAQLKGRHRALAHSTVKERDTAAAHLGSGKGE
jgi:hypothetical protein